LSETAVAEPQKTILIAEIGAAHGVRGELRVKAFTADPLGIADYGPLHGEKGGVFRVKSMRHLKDDMLVVAFDGVADRTAAEKLTRTKLYVERSALPPPDEDEFYHADLVGLAVETTTGEAIGTVIAVANFGADDLLEVRRPGGASVYVPFSRAVVPTLDFAAGKAIIAPPEGLLDEPSEPTGEDAP
jgi:16S rRNA processing protein RimM